MLFTFSQARILLLLLKTVLIFLDVWWLMLVLAVVSCRYLLLRWTLFSDQVACNKNFWLLRVDKFGAYVYLLIYYQFLLLLLGWCKACLCCGSIWNGRICAQTNCWKSSIEPENNGETLSKFSFIAISVNCVGSVLFRLFIAYLFYLLVNMYVYKT